MVDFDSAQDSSKILDFLKDVILMQKYYQVKDKNLASP